MDPQEYFDYQLSEMFKMARARFGSAVKGYWFCDDEACPGCRRPIDLVKYKGQDAISLNAFMHRKPGILIGYLLCRRCARQVFKAAEKNQMRKIPLHGTIEQTLIEVYERYVGSLPA